MSALDEENEVRPGETDGDEDIGEFVKFKKWVIAAHRHRGKWRKQAQQDYDMMAGHQWLPDDEQILQEQNRPKVTFNRVAPIVRAVCGLEVNNRQSVVYLPREQGDVGINETLTAAAKWVRDQTHAEDEESEAFRDVVICGEGWTETRMEYDEDPQGKVVKERIYPLEMGANVGSGRANYSDARMLYRVRDMDPDDVRALLDLPDELEALAMHCKWLGDDLTPEDGGEGFKKDYPDETRAGVASSNNRRPREVRIVQLQYWQRERVHLVAQAGVEEMQKLSPEDFATFEARAAQMAEAGQPMEYQSTTVPQKVYYECFLLGSAVYGKRKIEFNRFQFQAMTGERDTKLKCFYGLVRDMHDPQMWANKWLAQTMNIINSNAKGGIIAESDAFTNLRKAEEQWADPTKIILVKPGSLGKNKIKERTPIPLPQGLDQLMMFAISSIRDVTGVNLELLGQADREQAASLEMQRRQSAMTVLASMFDSLRRYRKYDGKLTLHFINMLPDGTLIRITEQGKHKYIPLTKDPNVEKYDVIIDEAPTSPDQKQFIWATTSQILQLGILPPQAAIALLKYSPFPESVVQEIREAMGMDGNMPPEQMAMKLQQAEQALQVLEQQLQQALQAAQEAEDDRAVEIIGKEIDEYKAKTDRLRAIWDAQIKAVTAQMKGQPNQSAADEPSQSI